MIMETGKSKIFRVGCQAEDPGKSQCCGSSQKTAAEFLLVQGRPVFLFYPDLQLIGCGPPPLC